MNTKEVQNGFDLDWIDTEMDSENNRQVHQIISILPPREKEVIQLRFYEGLDNEAIADIMGIHFSRVSQIKSQAVLRLRNSIRARSNRDLAAATEIPNCSATVCIGSS